MTARTLTLNIIGDSSRAQRAIDGVSSKAQSASKKMSHAFGSVLGTLNSTGVLGPFGAALDHVKTLMEGIESHGKGIGKALLGVGAAGVGIGGALSAAAGPEIQAKAQLTAALEAVGKSYDDYGDQVEAAVRKNERFGHSGADTQDALARLVEGLKDPAKALNVLGEAADLAAAQHISLSDAAVQMIRVIGGHGAKILAKFGEAHTDAAAASKKLAAAQKEVMDAASAAAKAHQHYTDVVAMQHGKAKLTVQDHIRLRDAMQADEAAGERLDNANIALASAQDAARKSASQLSDEQKIARDIHGQAGAAVAGFTGHLKVWKAQVEDSAARLGQRFGPALMGASAGISLLGGAVQAGAALLGKFRVAQEAATSATEAMTVAEDAAAVSEGVALGPILLIIGAVAALGVGIFELVKHWHTVWGAIKHVLGEAWGFIHRHLTLFLTAFFGPLGLAVGVLVKHWKGAWQGISAVLRFAWNDVLKPVFGFIQHWMIGPIVDGLKLLWSIWSKIFHDIKAVVLDVWHVLKPIFDAIAKGVGGIVSVVGKVGGFIGGIGGKIGHFLGFDSGGVVPGPVGAPRLVVAHGGETILPTHRGGVSFPGSGGDLHVTVPLYIDGRRIGEATARITRDHLIRLGRSLPNVGLA